MMNIFRLKPSNFPKNPCGYAKNQLGHAIIGAVWAAGIVIFWLIAHADIPSVTTTLTIIGATYAAYELIFQGWKGWNTAEDWTFVTLYGAAPPAFYINWHEYIAAVIAGIGYAHILIGTAFRAIDAHPPRIL